MPDRAAGSVQITRWFHLSHYGWDVGGAHLKVAAVDAHGELCLVRQLACPLWQGLAELRTACAALALDPHDRRAVHAVTMTGELCDVFVTREEGVAAILGVMADVCGSGRLLIYAGDAGWLAPDAALVRAADVASMNWFATADLVARHLANALLVDVGSTTTDLVPICDGRVSAEGRTDAARLTREELIYQGASRTPVMAVCERVPYGGAWQSLAAEYFANMGDVYRLTGDLLPEADLQATADGRGKDRLASARRLARMLGRDAADGELAAVTRVAHYIAYCQFDRLQRAYARLASGLAAGLPLAPVVGAGVGRFQARRLARCNDLRFMDFAELAGAPARLADAAAICAPAVALARLAWMLQ